MLKFTACFGMAALLLSGADSYAQGINSFIPVGSIVAPPTSTTVYTWGGANKTFVPIESGRVLITAMMTITATSGTAGVGIEDQIGVIALSDAGGACPGANASTSTYIPITPLGGTTNYSNPTTVKALDVQSPGSAFGVASLNVGEPYCIDVIHKAKDQVAQMVEADLSFTVTELP